MKKILSALILVSALGFFAFRIMAFIKPSAPVETPSVVINNKAIKVEIADSLEDQIKGLSNKKNLCADCGMLFIFPDTQVRKFWMKNMNFPLDILWIADDNIVNISKNLLPERESPKETYSSIYPVNYVLEINDGYAARNEIKIGDKVKYNL